MVVVLDLIARSLFIQKELGERRGIWRTVIKKYDLEFKPSMIVRLGLVQNSH